MQNAVKLNNWILKRVVFGDCYLASIDMIFFLELLVMNARRIPIINAIKQKGVFYN